LNIFSLKCSATTWFSARLKKRFLSLQTLNKYLAIYKAENSKTFSAFFQTNELQDPIVTCIEKYFFFQNLVLVLKMTILERFGGKT